MAAPRTPRPTPVHLTPAQKNRLRELLNGSFSSAPNLALRAVGIDEALLRQCISLPEGELATADILHALADEVRAVKTVQATQARRLDEHGKAIAGLKPALTAAHGKADALDRRIKALESIIGTPRFAAALEAGVNGGRKSFIKALRDAKVTDEHIREVLVLVDDGNEVDMTDEQLFGQLFESVRSTRADLTTLTGRVDDHARILGPEGTNITSLRGRVTHVEHAHDELKQSIVVSSRISPAAWFTGLTVFLLSWFMFSRNNWVVDSVTKINGADIHTIGELPMNHWWYQAVMSGFIGLVAFAIIWGMQRNRVRSATSSSTRTNTQVPVYAPVRVAAPADATLVYPPITPAPAAVRAQVAAQSNNA